MFLFMHIVGESQRQYERECLVHCVNYLKKFEIVTNEFYVHLPG